MEELFYYRSADLAYTAEQLFAEYAIDVSNQQGNNLLNSLEVFPVNLTPDPYDPNLFTTVASYAVVGETANQSWSGTPSVSLADAQVYAKSYAKTESTALTQTSVNESGYGIVALLASASKLSTDRGADVASELSDIQSLMTDLDSTLTAIDNAADVPAIQTILDNAYPS